MKRLILSAFVLTLAVQAFAQTTREAIIADPSLAAGVYRPYPTEVPDLTPAPKGYKPFYISHYGRHGSRYILRDNKFDDVISLLEKGFDEKGLTAFGEEVYTRMDRAAELCVGRAGDLTPLGHEQHRQIAARMYRNYPEIFKHNPKILAEATVVPRVILSMGAFTTELKMQNPKLEIVSETGSKFMRYLNPYNYLNDPVQAKHIDEWRYPAAAWSDDYRAFRASVIDNSRLMKSLFTNEFLKQLTADEVDHFAFLLFKNVTCMPGTPVNVRFDDIFTPEEMYTWWRLVNLLFYQEKGPSGVDGGFLNRVCDTLVKDFIDKADDAVKEGVPAVDLRFGHDGVIMGLLNSLQIEPWCTPAASFADAENYWRDYNIPMACNVQWIFYRNKAGEVLVKMMLNEEDTLFPKAVPADLAPYYRWEDVKSFYREYLKSSHYKFDNK